MVNNIIKLINNQREKMKYMNTFEAAQYLGVQPNTLREALSRTGSYYGVIPLKGVNGRLRWPAQEVESLMFPAEKVKP